MKKPLLQRLYESEINIRIEIRSFAFDGFTVRLGDEWNGLLAEATLASWGEAEAWLRDQALKFYPDSDFARMEHAANDDE